MRQQQSRRFPNSTIPADRHRGAAAMPRRRSMTDRPPGSRPVTCRATRDFAARLAADFLRFCQRNPKPCPLLGVSEPGDPRLPALGADLDIRTDVPRYRVWKTASSSESRTNFVASGATIWSASSSAARSRSRRRCCREACPLRHVERGTNVPMYRTNMPTRRRAVPRPAGRLDAAVEARRRDPRDPDHLALPAVHGAPVHIGLPDAIGIGDLAKPDYGDAVPVAAGEMPVFWACGVTPQAAIARRGRRSHHACAGLHAGDGSQERAARAVLMPAHFPAIMLG